MMIIHSPKELALFVSSQRKRLKLSQAAVAKRVGLKQTTVCAFENKPEGTKLDTLFRILSAANLDISLTPKDEIALTPAAWKEEW